MSFFQVLESFGKKISRIVFAVDEMNVVNKAAIVCYIFDTRRSINS